MLKKFGRGLSSGTLRLFLFLLAVITALVIVFGTAAHIKTALKTSNVYGTFVDNALDQAKNSSTKQGDTTDGISFDQPEVRAAAKIAVPPILIQTSAENALDGIYTWLQSKTSTPQFSINLTPAKQTFANTVGASLEQRIQGLPVCTLAQLQTLNVNTIDLFNLPCKPPGVNLETERQKVVSDIASSKDFLEKPVITAQDLPKDERGQTIVQKASEAPKVYHRVMLLPWILGIIALLSAGIVFLLHDSKQRALRSLATTFVAIGVILIASSLLIGWLFTKVSTNPSIVSHNNGLQQSGISVANHLSNDVSHVIVRFGIVYIIIGAIIFGVWGWLAKKKPPAEPRKSVVGKTSPDPPSKD